jgi:hypothetical protein
LTEWCTLGDLLADGATNCFSQANNRLPRAYGKRHPDVETRNDTHTRVGVQHIKHVLSGYRNVRQLDAEPSVSRSPEKQLIHQKLSKSPFVENRERFRAPDKHVLTTSISTSVRN